ncbi:MAG: hypothetical protein FWE80_03780, partial [Oscillospiraceae bacterium]|nr:hypothetical protein [Oscillospiraceae bacterium]
DVSQAIAVYEQALAESTSDKFHGSAAAVLCFLYHRAGMTEKAEALARSRPHARESRELLLPHFLEQPERNAYLRDTLPGILSAICALVDGRAKTDEEQLRALLLGVEDEFDPAEAMEVIRGFLMGAEGIFRNSNPGRT